jgi:hypothetical protein
MSRYHKMEAFSTMERAVGAHCWAAEMIGGRFSPSELLNAPLQLLVLSAFPPTALRPETVTCGTRRLH